jgi:formylglycine-generating enzyme required for sulfatase activity
MENCGPNANENCCLSPVVLGGTYNRGNDATAPATVSDFRLDRFEITVGRFRSFVNGYPANKPVAGAGAHPLIPNSGWQSAWDTNLPSTKAGLTASPNCDPNTTDKPTWTDTPGANENKPLNCIDWRVAFAFCAWDRGRLPTEAEWNYAAAGGSEQREYPWSNPPSSVDIDISYTVFQCESDGMTGCSLADILHVGSKSPKGDGRWKQADLGGGVFEWTMDNLLFPYAVPCVDCANIGADFARLIRGGGWFNEAPFLLSTYRLGVPPNFSFSNIGIRCARTP